MAEITNRAARGLLRRSSRFQGGSLFKEEDGVGNSTQISPQEGTVKPMKRAVSSVARERRVALRGSGKRVVGEISYPADAGIGGVPLRDGETRAKKVIALDVVEEKVRGIDYLPAQEEDSYR